MLKTSKEVRNILNISSQYLYSLKKENKIDALNQIPTTSKDLYKVPEQFTCDKGIAIYCRVSTSKQKNDLETQISMIKSFLISSGHPISSEMIFSDIGSGMNENRTQLNKLLKHVVENKISKIYISHKDRLTRFGFGYLKNICAMYECEIIELDKTEEKSFQELTEDLIAIIHHFQ